MLVFIFGFGILRSCGRLGSLCQIFSYKIRNSRLLHHYRNCGFSRAKPLSMTGFMSASDHFLNDAKV